MAQARSAARRHAAHAASPNAAKLPHEAAKWPRGARALAVTVATSPCAHAFTQGRTNPLKPDYAQPSAAGLCGCRRRHTHTHARGMNACFFWGGRPKGRVPTIPPPRAAPSYRHGAQVAFVQHEDQTEHAHEGSDRDGVYPHELALARPQQAFGYRARRRRTTAGRRRPSAIIAVGKEPKAGAARRRHAPDEQVSNCVAVGGDGSYQRYNRATFQ